MLIFAIDGLNGFSQAIEAVYGTYIQKLAIESLNDSIKRRTNSKGVFPTIDAAFKVFYLATQEVQEKWNRNGLRSWSKIMKKYTK